MNPRQETLLLIEEAKQNIFQYQYELGARLISGYFVEQNFNNAVYWYIKPAIKSGSPDAKFNLGSMILEGAGVPQSFELGLKLVESAAREYEWCAMDYLAKCYETGRFGVKKDKSKSKYWRAKSEEEYQEPEEFEIFDVMNHFDGWIFSEDVILKDC